MSETTEQRIARKEIKLAIEGLLQACSNNNAAFCGFVWGVDPPILVRFGNVKEQGADFTALLLKLETIVNEKQESKLVVNDPLSQPVIGNTN